MGFEIVEGKNVTEKDIYQALQLDYLVYDEIYYAAYDNCLQWNKVNNRIYTMIRDTDMGMIVAYVNITPITEDYYDKIRSGTFVDTTLPASAIVSYDLPGMYDLYFSSVVIHSDYQNTGLFRPLVDAITAKFISLADDEIYARRMIADAVTDRGIQFCKMFGMEEIKNSTHGSRIYEVSMLPPKFKVLSKSTKTLYDIYKNVDFLDDDVPKQPASTSKSVENIKSNNKFDVFISVKKTDENGGITRDYAMAQELFTALKNSGINTFFSDVSLEVLGAAAYQEAIDEALECSKIMIVVGTSTAYLESRWVKYEWSSFVNDILSGLKKGVVFSYIDEISPHMLPRALRQSQSFDKKSCSLDYVCQYIKTALLKL